MAETRGPEGNILFIVMDQMRADCLIGALANAARLPNIRALMGEGVSFANHFTVTTPCGPARASLLTGLYAMNHRSVRNGAPLAAQHDNLALALRRAGREPLLFGYTDSSPDPTGRDPADPELADYEGLTPGFTEVAPLRFAAPYPWLADLKAKGYDVSTRARVLAAVDPDGRGRINAPTQYSAEDSDTAFLTNETLRHLAVRSDRPWVAHVTYIRPHPPLAAPAPYCDMIAPEDMPHARLPESVAAERAVHPFSDAFFAEPSMSYMYRGFDGRMDLMPEAVRQTLRAVYLGLAAEVDHHIGRLVGWLKESGQYDDTLIVVTGDHGEMLGDHFMWGKQTIYDASFRIPLVIRDPRRRAAAGRVVEDFTECIDVAPTILDWIGAPRPLSFNGRVLTPFLDGGAPEAWRDHVFCELEFGDPLAPTLAQRRMGLGRAEANAAILRERRFKYVHFNGGQPPLLFDMLADPDEMRDLAGDPEFQPEIARLARKMLDHRMTHAHHALSLTAITPDGPRSAPPPAG